MTERGAFLLILLGATVFEVVAILGMAALGAGSDLLVFGLIIPLLVAPYLSSRVVMYYGEARRRECH
jgi:hypothetical protein